MPPNRGAQAQNLHHTQPQGHLRIAASILCRCGVQPGDLVRLPDLCRPDRFKSVIGTLVERDEGRVSAYVEQVAIAAASGCPGMRSLTDAEIAEVKALRRSVYWRGLADRKNDVHPDQKILDQLDDAECMNALLALPTRTAASVVRARRVDRKSALKIQMAAGAGDLASRRRYGSPTTSCCGSMSTFSGSATKQETSCHPRARDGDQERQARGALSS